MKTYTVYLPFTGYISMEVEADSEDKAIEKALEEPDYNEDSICELEFHRKIVGGNVFYGCKNEVEVEELE